MTVLQAAISNVKNVKTLPCTPKAPNAQNATDVTSSSFTTHWGSVPGPIDHKLDVSTSNTFATYVPGYQDLSVGNVTSYPVTGLSAHTTYYYRLRTSNGSATSYKPQFQREKCTDVALRSEACPAPIPMQPPEV